MAEAPKIEISTQLLRTLHRIHGQRADLMRQLARGPLQIKAGEGLIANAAAAVEEAKARLKKATMIADEKQLQLKSRELRIDDLKVKLNSAASNREFSTLQEQIAADLQANSVLSDEILEALEELDLLMAAVNQADKEWKQQATEQRARVQEVERTQAGLELELQAVEAKLAASEQQIPVAARGDYDRLVGSRGEEALAPIESDSCGGCNQMLTTNFIDRLRLSLLVRCPNCNAFLYIPEDTTVR
jgi:predicted  nucleic acid-binding Zn-ribbon protein